MSKLKSFQVGHQLPISVYVNCKYLCNFLGVLHIWTNKIFYYVYIVGDFQGNTEAPSVAIMKSHIKELIAQLSKAEDDKEKIAKEAYNKAMEIKREADKRLEDAHACQMKQANLIERLKVGLKIYCMKLKLVSL